MSRTLETLQEGALSFNETISAHPKVDPTTNQIYNFGFDYQRDQLILFKFDKDMRELKRSSSPMAINMVHDICLAGQHLVIFEQPFSINKLRLLLGTKGFGGLLEHQP